MKIHIEKYTPEWKTKFEDEKKLLTQVLSGVTFQIEHIGSTSVEGLGAKPVIDILIGLSDFSIADKQVTKIIKTGYHYLNQYEDTMPYRRFFTKDDKAIRTHHIHMVQLDAEFWKRHIAFRNYLRNHPKELQEYDSLKKELASKEWKDGNEYAEAKSEFIRMIEQKAL